jgi:hypothetical protein
MFIHFNTYDNFILFKNLSKFIKLKLHVNFIYKNDFFVGCIFHLNNQLNL